MKASAAIVLVSLLVFQILPAYADIKTITSEATYAMGDGETPLNAEAMVLQKAKQVALEQAGTYIESYTKVQNYKLTTDEIQTIAGGVLEVTILDKKRQLIGDGTQFYIKIKATITTDKIQDLAKRIKGKNEAEEYKKLREDYSRLSAEFENLKQAIAKAPSGPQREATLNQIREREKAFAIIQQREDALFERLVSGERLFTQVDAQIAKERALEEEKRMCLQKSSVILNDLYNRILQDYIITVGEPQVAATKQDLEGVNLTVPMTAKASKAIQSDVADANRSLCLAQIEYLDRYAIYGKFQIKLENLRVVLEGISSDGRSYICHAETVKPIKMDLDGDSLIVLAERPFAFRATMKIPRDALKSLEKVRGRIVAGKPGSQCGIFHEPIIREK